MKKFTIVKKASLNRRPSTLFNGSTRHIKSVLLTREEIKRRPISVKLPYHKHAGFLINFFVFIINTINGY